MSSHKAQPEQFVYIVTHDSSGHPLDHPGSAEGLQTAQIVLSHDVSDDFVAAVEDEDLDHDTIWSKCNNALRDLLVFLVQKHRIEEVMDSKVKSQLWEKLIGDFNALTNGEIMISKPQMKSWLNLKHYNKNS